MALIVCLLIPALLLECSRRIILKSQRTKLCYITEYIRDNLIINMSVIFVLISTGRDRRWWYCLHNYMDYAFKFFAVACFFAILLFVVDAKIKIGNLLIIAESDESHKTDRSDVVMIAILLLLLCVLMIIRIGNTNFWADECYSILVARHSLFDIVQVVIDTDVNPPLYYYLLAIFTKIIDKPLIYRIVSFIPYVILLAFTAKVMLKEKLGGVFGYSIFIIFASLLTNAFEFMSRFVCIHGHSFFAF